jgi:hypothetical protein
LAIDVTFFHFPSTKSDKFCKKIKKYFLLRKKIAHTTFTFVSLLRRTNIMTNLPFTIDALEEMIASGYVKMTKHPEQPLYIYNYMAKAQYEYMWNEVTILCRGLILDE